MNRLLLSAVFACLTALTCAPQGKSPEPRLVYELYSWRDNGGEWTFTVLYNTSRLKTPEEIFDEKKAIHGVSKLKQRISHLEQPSQIIWVGKLIFNGKPLEGTERLGWPPKEIRDEVRRYAAARHIEVTGDEYLYRPK